MTAKKLSIEDFYHQFHGHHHHNDAGEHVKPEWHKINPRGEKRHKPLDLKALRNRVRSNMHKVKGKVMMAKTKDGMALEITLGKKKKAK